MPERDDIERVWDLVEKIGVGMLTTRFAGGLRARPVEPRLDRDAELIRIVTDVRGIWHRSDDVWWPGGPDNPNVRVIVLTPLLAELWDGPSSPIVAA